MIIPIGREEVVSELECQIHQLMGKINWDILSKAKPLIDRIPETIHLTEPNHKRACLVIPFSLLSLEEQLAMIDIGGGPGYAFLSGSAIENLYGPETVNPYLISDIENGAMTRGQSPITCCDVLQIQKRVPLNACETIAFMRKYPNLIYKHKLIASGSRIRDERDQKAYSVCFDIFSKQIKMKREHPDRGDELFGSPSYGALIV
jgi:hypothetical protein